MKLPAIIAELKAAIANDCLTVVMDGRMVGIERDASFGPVADGLMTWYERKIRHENWPHTPSLIDRWGVENWTALDYATFGDGRGRRNRWVRQWLLREFGLREPGKGEICGQRSDRVWMEAANAS